MEQALEVLNMTGGENLTVTEWLNQTHNMGIILTLRPPTKILNIIQIDIIIYKY